MVVDYAHTPDSILGVLRATRPLATGRLIVVFGCGGDRDRAKRPLMGRAATSTADLTDHHDRQPALGGPDRDHRRDRAGRDRGRRRVRDRARPASRDRVGARRGRTGRRRRDRGQGPRDGPGVRRRDGRPSTTGPWPARSCAHGGAVTHDRRGRSPRSRARSAAASTAPTSRSRAWSSTRAAAEPGRVVRRPPRRAGPTGHGSCATRSRTGRPARWCSTARPAPGPAIDGRLDRARRCCGWAPRNGRHIATLRGRHRRQRQDQHEGHDGRGAVAPRIRTHASPGSFNNEIGLPMTLLGAPRGTEVVVAELGARRKGDVAMLCEIARPEHRRRDERGRRAPRDLRLVGGDRRGLGRAGRRRAARRVGGVERRRSGGRGLPVAMRRAGSMTFGVHADGRRPCGRGRPSAQDGVASFTLVRRRGASAGRRWRCPASTWCRTRSPRRRWARSSACRSRTCAEALGTPTDLAMAHGDVHHRRRRAGRSTTPTTRTPSRWRRP